ncbi:MAG: chemotaxis protein CheW [Desulfobacterales bacterium]|nr:chemotaxis protein CheW [Desulfobacterales bacterium]
MIPAQDHQNQIVSFRLKDTPMGVPILDIREILPMIPLTPVQMAQPHIAGLVNLRGRILTILDMAVLLGMEPVTPTALTHMVVFKHHDAGFWVDEIGDVITPETKSIAPIPANMGAELQAGSRHMIKLPREVVVVLEPEKILRPLISDPAGGDR